MKQNLNTLNYLFLVSKVLTTPIMAVSQIIITLIICITAIMMASSQTLKTVDSVSDTQIVTFWTDTMDTLDNWTGGYSLVY